MGMNVRIELIFYEKTMFQGAIQVLKPTNHPSSTS